VLPELGVGLTYSSALEPLIAAHSDRIQVLEIEPQTLWTEQADPKVPYRQAEEVLAHLAALPGAKLVHSVGTPVGGSVRAHAAQIPLLRDAIDVLGAPWASEHLSFNLTRDFFTGFFLPPRQTASGVRLYVDAIRRLQDALGLPLAIETPVNYLRPRSDEMPDGQFVGAVADMADCGILLDLHNLYCNERNGRAPVDDFIAAIDRSRVWEVHLAGGFELQGFWLDAHSGAIPPPLLELCRRVVPTLSNLKAMIFELFPSFLPNFGLEATLAQLEAMHALWALRRAAASDLPRSSSVVLPDAEPSPEEWESALGRIVIGREPLSVLEQDMARDPGTRLVQALIKEFRASMVAGVYRLTCRLLLLTLGEQSVRTIFEAFWEESPPRQFSATEADAFGDFLDKIGLDLVLLPPVLSFERATVATLRDGRRRLVRFDHDPFPLLRALTDGVLPPDRGELGSFEIEIVDEGPIRRTERASLFSPFH
jgi:uncharacterized protein (UPF0276 family)